ncbi:MAG: hypothetical protein U9N61_06635, partial [Euryarchaeota archaeon]|nr:hypothetical protein [Euryarchaeota archaeon]
MNKTKGGERINETDKTGAWTYISIKRQTILVSIFFALVFFLAIPQPALATVTSSVDESGVLTVTSDAADQIKIWCSDGKVWVNGYQPGGYGSPEVDCFNIRKIIVKGGPGNNLIDLSDITCADFPVLDEGNVEIYGGAGDDEMIGSEFCDAMFGGDGNDFMVGGDGDDDQNGGAGNDFMVGDDGDDDQNGGAGNDEQYGDDGDDVQDGGAGNDVQNGNDGDDVQNGDAGDDEQNGGAGNDVQAGGDGGDVQNGDAGNDVQNG